MTEFAAFADGRTMANAITQASRKLAGGTGAANVKRHVDQAYYDRFLCRIFSDPTSPFVLKGGTRMIASVPDARATRDVDLESRQHTLHTALAALRRLSEVDLDDFLEFTYAGHRVVGSHSQPLVSVAAVKFEVTIVGVGSQNPLNVDLALHPRLSRSVVRSAPAFRLSIPQFLTYDYVMIAPEDQAADKICALMAGYGVAAIGSSRAKDLVDLVILTLHEAFTAGDLYRSITSEALNRGLPRFDSIIVSPAVRAGYAKLAGRVAPVADYRSWESAAGLVNRLVGPILTGRVLTGHWSPCDLTWKP